MANFIAIIALYVKKYFNRENMVAARTICLRATARWSGLG